jgi:hypothetical protein
MVSPIQRVESIPRAARAIPYIPASWYEMKMQIAKRMTGRTHERYPRANP